MSRTVVIGAGIAGLTSAIALAKSGEQTTLITAGLGGLTLSQGSVDIWGRINDAYVDDPFAAVAAAPQGHPYHAIGAEAVEKGLAEFNGWLSGWFHGDLHHNRVIPTAVGSWRPTCLVPDGYNIVPQAGQKWVVIGFARYKDFQAELIAGNLSRSPLPGGGNVSARSVILDVVARGHEVDSSGLSFARSLDDMQFRANLAQKIREVVSDGEIVALPAVLGVNDPYAFADLTEKIGHEVTEVVTPPSSVPGIRLDASMRRLAQHCGVRIVIGAAVNAFASDNGRVTSVTADTSGHATTFSADHFILAAGGFESGAIELDSAGTLSETIFGLPVQMPEGDPFDTNYWATHPLFTAGVTVDHSMRPLDAPGKPVFANVYAAGGVIAGAARWKEKSGEGIAIGSAWAAAQAVLEAAK